MIWRFGLYDNTFDPLWMTDWALAAVLLLPMVFGALGAVFRPLTPFTLQQSMMMGFLISFLGFFGDLQISAVKRDLGLKDMGQLIPGHGGVLDRFDSLIAALPFFYLSLHVFPVRG